LPPTAYRYVSVKLSDKITVVYRCRITAVEYSIIASKSKKDNGEKEDGTEDDDNNKTTPFPVYINGFLETDLRQENSFRSSLQTKGAVVLSSFVKNNPFLSARWIVEAHLGYCAFGSYVNRIDKPHVESASSSRFNPANQPSPSYSGSMRTAFVSRTTQTTMSNHMLIGMQSFSVEQMAGYANVNLGNCWEILLRICNEILLANSDDGDNSSNKYYVLLRDVNKPAYLRLYNVPYSAYLSEPPLFLHASSVTNDENFSGKEVDERTRGNANVDDVLPSSRLAEKSINIAEKEKKGGVVDISNSTVDENIEEELDELPVEDDDLEDKKDINQFERSSKTSTIVNFSHILPGLGKNILIKFDD
jgi:hypothetical protein